MRIPCDTKQGKGIQRLLDSLGPGQMRLYCKVATPAQRRNFAAAGHKQALFSPNQPIGVNTIRKMLKSASKRLGYPESVTGHAFRRLFITTLVNDSGVSTEEALASSRHSSVAASRAYQIRGNNSEIAKFRALGLIE